MSITLQALEAALFTALLTTKTGGATPIAAVPFRTVGRWMGEVTADDIDEAFLGVCPGALLAHEGSDTVARGELDYVETVGHDVEVVERHLFRVYVAVQDTRGDDAIVLGGVGTPSILACAQAVKEALAGLRIPGLLNGGVVHLVNHRPWLIRRGIGRADVIRFAALSALPETTEALPGHPMTRLDAAINTPALDVDGQTVTVASSRTTTT